MSKMSQALIQYTLEKETRVKVSGKRSTYVVPLKVLAMLGIRPWNRQRPIDETRSFEISDVIEKQGDVSGIIMLAWHPTEGLVVYDGQHRCRALLDIYLCNNAFDIQVIIEVIWDATEDEIIESFRMINRCVPVSELYIEQSQDTASVRLEIDTFVADLSQKYKGFVSTKAKPNRPNFNRDALTSEIYNIWSDLFEKKYAIKSILDAITSVNKEYHTNPMSAARDAARKTLKKSIEKCEEFGFWLFTESGRLNTGHIEYKINAA